MVTHNPLKLLVCLAILLVGAFACSAYAYNASDVVPYGIQGDALSADPKPSSNTIRIKTNRPGRSYSSRPTRIRSNNYGGGDVSVRVPPMPTAVTFAPAACPPSPQPLGGMFMPPGLPFQTFNCGPVLPRLGCKQFTVAARLWYTTLNSNKIIWGTNRIGGPGTELDLNRDLGLRKHEYIAEYEARCQIRPNWGLRYAFMPIQYRDNHIPNNFFFFGNAFYPAGNSTLTKWDRNIHKWDIVYDWFQQCHATSSIFAGYALYDDKLQVSNAVQSRTRSQGFGLAYAGMSIERAVRDLGKATASINCRWSVQFLEGYFGWDGYTVGRIAVPFDKGRYGYLEAGWRWIVLQRDYPTNADKTNLDGVIGAVGLIF